MCGKSQEEQKDIEELTNSETTLTQSSESDESLHEMMKEFSKKENNSHIIQYSLRYQEFRYEMLERIRMYSKYLTEDNIIFMDFN